MVQNYDGIAISQLGNTLEKVSCIHNLITPIKTLITHISDIENLQHVELIFAYIEFKLCIYTNI